MNRRVVCLALAAATVAFGNTQVNRLQVTNTQALISVLTDQPGNCVYRISVSSSLSPVANDVNEALFPGSSSDARTGSVVQGNQHMFVAGTRTAAPGSDGKWYGRALAAATPHYGGVTCGTDAEVPFSFTTTTIPLGITYTDPVPFDSRGLGNYAVPTFDFSDLTAKYADPQTGFQFRLMTGPGQEPIQADTVTGSTSNTVDAGTLSGEILASGNWTNPNNCLVVDGSACTYNAAGQDVLMIRLASWCGPGLVCNGWNWSTTLGSGGFLLGGIDSYQLALTCNGGGSALQVDVAYSWNGISQGSEWETQTCPANSGTVTYPAALNGSGLAAWQGPNYPLIPGIAWETAQQKYTVNTAGTSVTLVSGNGTFSLDPRILTAGSKITINGVEYGIASIDSAKTATLTADAGTQSGVMASTSNFSVLIRKHSATAGTLNVDGATVKIAMSATWNNGGGGFQVFCSALTSTDAQGHVGRFCVPIDVVLNSGSIFWVTDDLQVRYIGIGQMPASSIGVPADEYNQQSGNYASQSMFDAADPNSWWIGTTLVATGQTTLVKATYHPSGAPGCTQPANYQNLPLDPNYSRGKMLSCNITYSELTRPSQGRDIRSQLPATLTSGKFGTSGPQLSFIQDGYAVLTSNSGQDTEAWITTVNLSTGLVNGDFSTYMNTSSTTGSYPCRACVLHGMEPADQLAPFYAVVYNNYMGGAGTGSGPYQLTVTTALSATPAISPSSCLALVTNPAVSWLIPYSDGCDTITLAGSDNIPCDPSPSPWETANAPACSWHSGATQWQAGPILPGDWIQDPATGLESMAFAQNTGGTTWIVIRNINPPHGPEMAVQADITHAYLHAHSANWTASLQCNMPGTPPVSVTEANGSGLVYDRWWYGVGHGVIRSQGSLGATFYPDLAKFGTGVRIANLPGAANTPETARLFNNPSFAGVAGLGAGSYVQSHPGWDGNPTSFTDYAPMAPGAGGQFTLWPQPGVLNVTGSLYKIPAARLVLPMNKRLLAQAVWAGMYNFQDVSGAGTITGTALDNFKYCSIDYPGATCGQSGETLGDVFMNIPQATIDGASGGLYDFNRANAVPLGEETLAVMQYYFGNVASKNVENLGRGERRLTTAFARYNGQDTYSNSKVIPNSNLLLFNCGTPNLQRLQDLCLGLMPADTQASPGNNFVKIAVPVAAADSQGQYAEIQFGYAENGSPDQFFCTSRKEACNTSSPPGAPFNWEGEARSLTNCGNGCTIQIPAIPGRLVYYRLRWSSDGTNWTNSSPGVAVAQIAAVKK
jgi:hypothetical protein